MEDYYTLKEIVFGLRKEQLRITKKLKELEKYLHVSDTNKCKNVELFVEDAKALSYSYVTKFNKYNSFLAKILDLLLGNFDQIVGYSIIGRVQKDENGKYIFENEMTINDKDQKEFNRKVNEILNDEFVQNIKIDIQLDENNYLPCLSLKHNTEYFNTNLISETIMRECVSYIAREDLIYVHHDYSNKSYQEFISVMLSLKIPCKLIPEYFQSIIDSNDDAKKDIIVPNTRIYGRKASFYINEEPNAFVLVKK